MSASLHQLLKTMVEKGGTDLHITTNSPPIIRIDGLLVPLNNPSLTAVDTKKLAYSILTDAQKHRSRKTSSSTFRSASSRSPASGPTSSSSAERWLQPSGASPMRFGLPRARPAGLSGGPVQQAARPGVVTGPTGSGKSTTLAAMIDKVNRERALHIITIEDPVEYLHSTRRRWSISASSTPTPTRSRTPCARCCARTPTWC